MSNLEFNQKLAESTTETAFHLTLSKSMIAAMQWTRMDCALIKAQVYSRDLRSSSNIPMGSHWITNCRALERRGLLLHHDLPRGDIRDRPYYTLTPAGERVWELLVMVGLVSEVQVPANLVKSPRRSSRKS